MTHFKAKVTTRGFTIIEVLIVLAIAGLILIIVFLAVPTLKRNLRNYTRKRDASQLYAAVEECFSLRRTFQSCDQVSDLPINIGTLGIYSGIHFGAACDDWVIHGCAQLPPTVDEMNWLNYLKCINNGTGLSSELDGQKFVVGYVVETPGTPATATLPAGYSGRCLYPE